MTPQQKAVLVEACPGHLGTRHTKEEIREGVNQRRPYAVKWLPIDFWVGAMRQLLSFKSSQ